MADWTSGYVTETDYTHGCYSELKPLSMRQALLSKGVQHRWGATGSMPISSSVRCTRRTWYLASPVVGGGITVNRLELLFLKALKDGKATPADWGEQPWSVLFPQG